MRPTAPARCPTSAASASTPPRGPASACAPARARSPRTTRRSSSTPSCARCAASPGGHAQPGPRLAQRPLRRLDRVRLRRVLRRGVLLHAHRDPGHQDLETRAQPGGVRDHDGRAGPPGPGRELLGRHLRQGRRHLLRHPLHGRRDAPGQGIGLPTLRHHPRQERRMPVPVPGRDAHRLQEAGAGRRLPVARTRHGSGDVAGPPARREAQRGRPGRLARRRHAGLRPARRRRRRPHGPVDRARRRLRDPRLLTSGASSPARLG